jgi:ABC-type antimicrobial peptide transport system permease subunit
VRSLLALVLIIVVLSLIAQSILGSLSTALIVVTGAFIAAGFLYLLLSLLIWVIGRLFPSLGVIDLKIALRQMVAGRARGASTLLALVIGVFSLSLITLFTESINGLLQSVLTDSGGNVLVFAQGISALAPVEAVLDTTEGVNDYIVTLAYSMTLVSFEDADTGQSYDLEGVRQRLRDADLDFPPFFQGSAGERDEIQQPILDGLLLNTSIEARALAGGTESNFIEGRDLTASDSGQAVMVITDNEMWAAIGLTAGDKLTYEIKGRGGLLSAGEAETVTFELVGIKQQSMVNVSFSNVSSYAPMGAFPESVSPTTVSLLVDVDEERIAQLRRELSSVPGTFVLETAVFTRLISSLIGTFTAFPSMVAALGLVVGGVVIANSVALTTMERRREIAVMKSIGLQRARVLAMLLLENGILGLIGGLIGVGIGLVALAILVGQTDAPVEAVPYATGLLLMLLCIVVALVAALTSAWGASGEKPLNVLRYE